MLFMLQVGIVSTGTDKDCASLNNPGQSVSQVLSFVDNPTACKKNNSFLGKLWTFKLKSPDPSPFTYFFQSILYPIQIKIPKLFIFFKYFKGVFTRVKNYVPWITKYAANGACRKPDKQERGGKARRGKASRKKAKKRRKDTQGHIRRKRKKRRKIKKKD